MSHDFKDPPMELLDLEFLARAVTNTPANVAEHDPLIWFFTWYATGVSEQLLTCANIILRSLASIDADGDGIDRLLLISTVWEKGLKNGRAPKDWQGLNPSGEVCDRYCYKFLRHYSKAIQTAEINTDKQAWHLASALCNLNILWFHFRNSERKENSDGNGFQG